MESKPVIHEYKTRLTWTGEKKGTLGCEGKPDIKGACPPEFGGHENIWTPEDLFIGSIELCAMSTFLWMVGKKKIKVKSYASRADGAAKIIDGKMQFFEVCIHPVVEVIEGADIDKVADIFQEIKKYCIISNSLTVEVILKPTIRPAIAGVL